MLKDYYESANNSTIKDYFMPKTTKPIPSFASATQKGDLVGDYYIWNHVHDATANLNTVFVVAAYIKTSSGVVFLNEVRYSARSLAKDYLTNRGYASNSADGSLYLLANPE